MFFFFLNYEFQKDQSQSVGKDKTSEKKTTGTGIFLNIFFFILIRKIIFCLFTDESDEKKSVSSEHRTAEERRKSLLDHHWAIPSKDRYLLIYVIFYVINT